MSRENFDAKLQRGNIEGNGEYVIDLLQLLQDGIRGLCRFWVLFLVLISACSSIFYAYGKMTYVPQYYASSTFTVNRSASVKYTETYYSRDTALQLTKTFPYIIENDALIQLVRDDLGVEEIPGQISVSTLQDTNMITLSVTAGTPEDAYHVLQSVLNNYPQVGDQVIGQTELDIVAETGMPTDPSNGGAAKQSAFKGLLLAVVLCMCTLLGYALTRHTVHGTEDVKNLLHINCLSSIPAVRLKRRTKKLGKDKILINNPHMSYGFIEANRTLRTRIEKDALLYDSRIYMVSSAEAREGKSMVATNLALSLASKGKKVVLIDLDLRHPSVAKALGLEKSEKGFIDILNGEATVNEAAVKYKNTSLLVLQGGNAVADTAQVLATNRIGSLCQALRKFADYVIIDTPPSNLLSDAALIVKHVDAGIYVVRQDYVPVDSIIEGMEMLTDIGLRLVGCVVNGVEEGLSGYGYGSYGNKLYS